MTNLIYKIDSSIKIFMGLKDSLTEFEIRDKPRNGDRAGFTIKQSKVTSGTPLKIIKYDEFWDEFQNKIKSTVRSIRSDSWSDVTPPDDIFKPLKRSSEKFKFNSESNSDSESSDELRSSKENSLSLSSSESKYSRKSSPFDSSE